MLRRLNYLKVSFFPFFYRGYKINYGTTTINYGNTAEDYGNHRHGLPKRFFDELEKQGVLVPGQHILDVGTGTGDTARNAAERGCRVTAIDPSYAMLSQAKKLSTALDIQYVIATAEETKQADHSFDAVTIMQAYHWINSQRAFPELMRVLKPHKVIVVGSSDWKATTGIAGTSQEVILRYNSNYNPYQHDFYYKPLNDLLENNFSDIKLIDFTVIEKYSIKDWVGRMSTTYGIGPSLPHEKVLEFKQELTQVLREKFPDEPLEIPHRCYAIVARKPAFFEAQLHRTPFFAILREPSKSFVNAIAQDETHTKPDYKKTMEEHSSYVKAFQKMGIATIVCPPDEDNPDGNFVEDTYFVLKNILIIQLNPGAPSRKNEYKTLEPYLPSNLPVHVIPKEFTIDGGDILKDGKDIYIGLSKRTQREAILYFENIVKKHGYRVYPVPVPEGLHLKSGMTCVTNKNYVIQKSFENVLRAMQQKDPSIQYFVVPENEKHAANVLAVKNGNIMMPDNCPHTRKYIEQFYPKDTIQEVSTDQVRQVDGAITCGHLLFQREPGKKSFISRENVNEPKHVKGIRSKL